MILLIIHLLFLLILAKVRESKLLSGNHTKCLLIYHFYSLALRHKLINILIFFFQYFLWYWEKESTMLGIHPATDNSFCCRLHIQFGICNMHNHLNRQGINYWYHKRIRLVESCSSPNLARYNIAMESQMCIRIFL